MKPLVSLMSLATAALLALPCLAGCTASGLVEQFPGLSPIFGPRATSAPFSLSRGSIRGRVFGARGKEQAIGLAFVTTGGLSTFSAIPKDEDVVQEDDTVKNKDNISVMHAFNEGDEPELAQRIIRKTPPTQADADRFVYLRLGEFFLEGVPEGKILLRASFGNVTSSPNPVTVYKNTIVEDVSLNLYIPEPMAKDSNGNVPRTVEWAKLEPTNGISVSVVTTRESVDTGPPITTSTISYKPDPPDVAVTLKSPPGSPGTVISAYAVTYEYTTPNQQRNNQPPVTVGPILVPTPPLIVPPAQEVSFGPSVILSIPIGSRTLNQLFSSPDEDDQPSLVIAYIEFRDDKGLPVPDRNLNALRVGVPLRAL